MTEPTRQEIEAETRRVAERHGVPFDLVWRQMRQESGYNPSARSSAGAVGLMQLMPGTARDLGVDPSDWRQNISGGVRYLRQQLDAHGGDLELALAAYNAGPGNVRARGRDWSRYAPETRDYVRNILGSGPREVIERDGRRYEIASSQTLAPTDTPESLRGEGYDFDPVRGVWFRVVDRGPSATRMLADDYAQRLDQREDLALDQEQARIVQASMIPTEVVSDVGRGLFLEGGQAAVSGVKRGINETLNLMDELGDWLDRNVAPGTLWLNGLDGDDSTPFAEFVTQNEAEARSRARNDGRMRWWERLMQPLSGDNRLPTNEGERPQTVTGAFIEGASQFLTGFAGGGRILRGWRAATRAGRIGKAMAQGAIADFAVWDGNEARLSNLLAEHAPEAVAPVFEFLSANEDDPELLGRAKSMLEGAGLGVATEALLGAVRALRAARMARREAQAAATEEGLQVPVDAPAEALAREAEEARRVITEALGSPEGPRFRKKVERAAQVTDQATRGRAGRAMAAEIAEGGPAENVFDINLARIETPDDVRQTIAGMADRFRDDVDLARRAQRSWDETRAAAEGMDWMAAMARRGVGEAVNAETALAFREALASAGQRVRDLAQEVAGRQSPSVAQQAAFRKAVAAYHAIQAEFMGARAEAGRALNAFRIPVAGDARFMRQLDSMLAESGGKGTAQELAGRINEAAKKGDVAINEVIRGGAIARTRAMVRVAYTNSLLSALGTPIVNVVGNAAALLLETASRAVTPRLARAFGGEATTQVGEAMALVHGYREALRDMFRLAPHQTAERIGADGAAYWREQGLWRGLAPGLDDAMPDGINLKPEREDAGLIGAVGERRPFSAAAWNAREDSVLGRALDVAQMAIESPSNINALMDDFFKAVAARGEIHAQAFRRTMNEGLTGEAARARMAHLLENPTDDMLEAAERQMHEVTFTRDDGQFEKALGSIRRMADSHLPVPVASMILPFLRTPLNLTSLAMRYSPLAPFSARFRNALAEGGAAAETAKARMAVGTALWSVWMGMAMDGQITGSGPGDRAQREAMGRADEFGGVDFQPYSVRFGDRWFAYERVDPFATGLSLVADFAQLLRADDWSDGNIEEASELIAHQVMALGEAFFDRTVLRGAFEFTEAVTSQNVTTAERFFMSRASGAVPGSGLLRSIRRAEDPYIRETHNVVTAIMNTVPGLSDHLPPARDLWGRPRTYETGLGQLYDAALPVRTRQTGASAIDLEILDNGVSVTMPSRSISVPGVGTVNLRNHPEIYSEYVRLAGEPAFEHLNAVANGRHRDSEFYFSLTPGPDGGRAEYIREVISAYREAARAQVLEENWAELTVLAQARNETRAAVRAR